MPSIRLRPQICFAPSRIQGTAQKNKKASTAGHSHRRTSGGKAEAQQAEIFSALAVSVNFLATSFRFAVFSICKANIRSGIHAQTIFL